MRSLRQINMSTGYLDVYLINGSRLQIKLLPFIIKIFVLVAMIINKYFS